VVVVVLVGVAVVVVGLGAMVCLGSFLCSVEALAVPLPGSEAGVWGVSPRP
jgi:hypothetical protein